MKMLSFAKRCAKEILRDPLNLAFGLGFPLALLFLLSAIQNNAPVDLFKIGHLAPGVTVFGLSFMTLFSATLIAKDRESSFLQRLYTTPLRPIDFILGYLLPILPISVVQSVVCYLAAVALALPVTINIFFAVIMILPVGAFYVSLGLLCGSVLNAKQVGGICGALLTNVSAWLSGVWFDPELLGEFFGKTARFLPFFHAVELERAILSGDFNKVPMHFLIVLLYAAATTAGAICLFLRQMKKQ